MKNKALICITTCNRLFLIKKFIWKYLDFCNNNPYFDFILSLDGYEEDYLNFCSDYDIPLIYSDVREGVGLSKNRVLMHFSDYEFYFFVDDDVELIDGKIFYRFIDCFRKTNFHHLSLNFPRNIIENNTVYDDLIFAEFGGAYFNFFSNEGLIKVGGWNPLFSKYKRYGHTEHSYRFFFQELTPAPFVVLKEDRKFVILHDPPHVSETMPEQNHQLINEEFELIKSRSSYCQLQILSESHYNGFKPGYNKKVAEFCSRNRKVYPLTHGAKRRNALAEYYFHKIHKSESYTRNITYLFLSLLNNPFNKPFKHFVKIKIFGYGK